MMTAARYRQLMNYWAFLGSKKHSRFEDWLKTLEPGEATDLVSNLRHEKRSAAAKQAVKTKRAKYKTWPTRRNDHK